MELIPAIDLIEGKVVRLSKGDFTKKLIYSDSPLEVAKKFEDAGIKRLHIVDLDGAAGSEFRNVRTLENIAAGTGLIIDFGGGLKSTEDVIAVLNAGAAMVNIGSIIVKNPTLFSEWVTHFGPAKFLPGADVLDMKIKIHGWKEETGIYIFDFVQQLIGLELTTIFCTDISKDGMLEGPATALYKLILHKFPSLNLIASGGVSKVEDLTELKKVGCSGVIIGKAFYEERITLEQMKSFINNN
ncbi:MAG: 1-(5-phosphoribosyl)-5-[(5-phosphoribosylamino)methylideneamino]imidazole-4-carboxamide isomerase [Ginsengibacter sp.]